MEPIWNDVEEDKEYLARRARRRERWMQERKRRQRRHFAGMLVLGILVLVMVIGIAVSVIRKKGGTDTGEEQNVGEQFQTGQNEQNAEQQNEEQQNAERHEEETQAPENDVEEEAESLKPDVVYRFEATQDTKAIYSEEVVSSHAILVDAAKDTIVATKGAYDRISPASMTKVLTVLVAAEAIGESKLEDTFTMTLEVTDYAYVNDCSAVGFLDGEVVTVRDLFYGTILPSGGDAAVGLATYVAGSHEAFVEMMNEKLESLGLSSSAHFTNCAGIYDKEHYCTVYDMAVIMKAAMQNDLCREVLSAHTYTTTPTTEHPEGITISNWFLRRIEDKDTGGLVVGGKTGFVTQSGNCAVSYQEYTDGTPYICVTAGSTSSWRCIYDHVEIYNTFGF